MASVDGIVLSLRGGGADSDAGGRHCMLPDDQRIVGAVRRRAKALSAHPQDLNIDCASHM